MQQLNLPLYNSKISERDGRKYIYDSLRRKDVALTPEEWVRQHFVNFIIEFKSYPSARIANEVSIKLNGLSKRCDTVVYDKFLQPLVIVEYKAPEVQITSAVFNQIMRYNSVMHVPYLIVSNGLVHHCCLIDYTTMSCDFLKDIPMYEEITR